MLYIVYCFVKEFIEKFVLIIIFGLGNLLMYCKDILFNFFYLLEKLIIFNILEDEEELMILKWF